MAEEINVCSRVLGMNAFLILLFILFCMYGVNGSYVPTIVHLFGSEDNLQAWVLGIKLTVKLKGKHLYSLGHLITCPGVDF